MSESEVLGINKVKLVGNLGSDPKFHYGKDGTAIAKLRVLTVEMQLKARGFAEDKQWHNVIVFERLAEACNTYLKIGSRVHIEGRLSTKKMTYKSGKFNIVTEVIASKVLFLENKPYNGTQYNDVQARGAS